MDESNFRQRISDLVRDIASMVQTIMIYGFSHLKTQTRIDGLMKLLDELFLERREIVIGVFAQEIIFEDAVFFSLSMQLEKFISDLKAKGIEKIIFKAGLTKEELIKFLNLLAMRTNEIEEKGGIENFLAAGEIRNIVVNRFGIPSNQAQALTCETKASVIGEYELSIEKARDILGQALNKEIDFISTAGLMERLVGLMDRNKTLLVFSLSIKEHDEYTFVHCVNVSLLVMLQAQNLQVERRMLFNFGLAAFLHDIGKLTVTAQLLQKPVSLTDVEFEEIKRHPMEGAKIILNRKNITSRIPLIVAFEHHLRYDLSGYPQIDYCQRPHLLSQITSIADYYDSLRSSRVYRKDYPPEKVYDIMQAESGKFFDPLLLKNFFSIIGKWPPGTVVELSNGDRGVVLENSLKDIFSPVVLVLYDTSGNKLSEPVFLNLSEQADAESADGHCGNISIIRSIYLEEKDRDKYIPESLMGK